MLARLLPRTGTLRAHMCAAAAGRWFTSICSTLSSSSSPPPCWCAPPSAPPSASNFALSSQISFVMDAFFLHFKNGISGEEPYRPVLSKRKQLDYELAFSIMCVGSFAICFPATLLRAKSRAWTCRCCIEHSKGDKGLLNGQHVSAHLFLYN